MKAIADMDRKETAEFALGVLAAYVKEIPNMTGREVNTIKTALIDAVSDIRAEVPLPRGSVQ